MWGLQHALLPCMMQMSYHGQSIGITEMTCMGMQVAECMEIAQKVFREDPYAENKLFVQHVTDFFGSRSQYELEKGQGAEEVQPD